MDEVNEADRAIIATIANNRVTLDSLPKWSIVPESEQPDPLQHSTIDFEPRFPVDQNLNEKFTLWWEKQSHKNRKILINVKFKN